MGQQETVVNARNWQTKLFYLNTCFANTEVFLHSL